MSQKLSYSPNFVLVNNKLLLKSDASTKENPSSNEVEFSAEELFSKLTANKSKELKVEKNSPQETPLNTKAYSDSKYRPINTLEEIAILKQELEEVVTNTLKKTLDANFFANQSAISSSTKRKWYKQTHQAWTYLLIITVLIIGSLNLYFSFNPFKAANIAQASDTFLINQNDIASNKTGKIGTKVLTNFVGNPALTEVGFKVKANKNSINSINDGNCKTPNIPPEVNGCSFVIAPSLLGLPKRGVVLKTMTIVGSMGGDSKIILDVKNYEKGTLQKSIGQINGSDLNTPIKLPQNLDTFQAINFRLWEKDTSIEITKLVFNYFYIDNLGPVSGKLTHFSENDGDNQAEIYWDANENGIYDLDIDERQDCRANFPGVFPVDFEKDGSFKVKRDSACFKDVKPDIWYTDDGKNALPPGKFLLLFDKSKKVVPFEVLGNDTDANQIIDYEKS